MTTAFDDPPRVEPPRVEPPSDSPAGAPSQIARWFITTRAEEHYRAIVGRDVDRAQVLLELGPLTFRAHLVKTYPDGRELWRGRAINGRRLRLIVGPPRPPHRHPALIGVLDEFHGASPPNGRPPNGRRPPQ